MSMTSSIYSWAAARVDEATLVRVMKEHGYDVRKTNGEPVTPPMPAEERKLFDAEVEELLKELSHNCVKSDVYVRRYSAAARRHGGVTSREERDAFRKRASELRCQAQLKHRIIKRTVKQNVSPETILLRTSFTQVKRIGETGAWEWYAHRCQLVGTVQLEHEEWLQALSHFRRASEDEIVDASST